MDSETKHRILKQLSQTQGDRAMAAIQKEFEKTKTALETEIGYYGLEEILAQLSIYAFRIPEETINVLAGLLDRVATAQFIELDRDYSYLDASEAQIRLGAEAIEVLERIRYFDLPKILKIFMDASGSEFEPIRKRARDALQKCAKYDVDIFYSGENRAGLGYGPQLDVIDFLEAQSGKAPDASMEALLVLADEVLSPTIEGTSWDYKTVTWSSGTVSANDDLKSIRARTLGFVFSQYNLELPEAHRRQIILAAFSATEFPRGECSSELQDIIETDTLMVFDWIKSIIPAETYPVLQNLEHSVYWRFYHGMTDAIKASALDIRGLLAANSEYQIYRNLIGFESIFEDWETSRSQERDFAKIEAERKAGAESYIESITDKTWPVWRARIFKFSETRSNDMATFPLFYEFLHNLAVTHPPFALELVRDHRDKIEFFKIPLFRGLLKGPLKEEFKPLALELAQNGDDLSALTKMFIGNDDIETDILDAVLQSAVEKPDELALTELLIVAGTSYETNPKFAVERLFAPAINALNVMGRTNWVQQIWYQREMRTLIANLDADSLASFLTALETTNAVSYQVEEFLKVIAEQHPDAVIDLFERRIEAKEGVSSSIDAIPHSFHGLAETLSQHPDMIVQKVKTWASHDSSMFQFRGGRLIAITFPEFGEGLEMALMPLAASGVRSDAKFVISILRNYHGEKFIHTLCRQLVNTHHDDKHLMTDVMISLETTGVVMGEFGMAEAYARKADELKYWLSDDEARVREFAKQYIEQLGGQEEHERLRAEESIELRKHKFGIRDKSDG